jgi:hypothetical protein
MRGGAAPAPEADPCRAMFFTREGLPLNFSAFAKEETADKWWRNVFLVTTPASRRCSPIVIFSAARVEIAS